MSRYVATELATDIVINVGDVKFYLHKVGILFDLQLVATLCNILPITMHMTRGISSQQ